MNSPRPLYLRGHIYKLLPFLVSSTVEMGRRGYPESSTVQNVVSRLVGGGGGSGGALHQQQQQFSAYPCRQQGCMVPGNRFSEVFPSSMLPPPPPLQHVDTDAVVIGAEVGGAGSLGRRKAAPPAPPLRTTTLRADEACEKTTVPLQVCCPLQPKPFRSLFKSQTILPFLHSQLLL